MTLVTLGLSAQVSNVTPQPQEMTSGAVYDSPEEGYELVSGVVGDKNVKKYKKLVPEQPESYYLHIDAKGTVVVVGRDEQGLFYGKQTLQQIRKDGKLQECTIRDWPDVRWRGVVEGFYGQPWSHDNRLRQLDFYGQHKMNVYIYGPKDDPYHRDHWRLPYPEREANQIKQLLRRASENHVRFYWAIHPGVDIHWDQADRDKLFEKLEFMYKLGVRSFAVFFDDIWGEGAKADKQAALLNDIDDNFVKVKKDVTPLVLCPTEYNRAWANDAGGYLRTLGTKLNKSVEVMWTGNSVVHCIDKESMEWINDRLERKAYIWWNFPVNDFVRDHILLGPAYGNGLDIADDVSGFVSNPMQYAESSKIALYNISEYTWNMKSYDYESSWNRAIEELMPRTHEALKVFASYNEDLGPNGHGFRRDESRHLMGVARPAAEGNVAAQNVIKTNCVQLADACMQLLNSKDNPWLINELRPWILQAQNVAEYGQMICDASIDTHNMPELYQKIKDKSKEMYQLEGDKELLHTYQTGIKTATGVLMPTLNQMMRVAVMEYNADTGSNLNPMIEFIPFEVSSNVAQLAKLPVTKRDKQLTVTPSNEVIGWQKDGVFGVNVLDTPVKLAGMDFDLGVANQAKNFKLEVQDVDGTWKAVSLCHYKEGETTVHTGDEIRNMTMKALRVTNVSGKKLEVYFRSFRIALM